jgi:hypothetical protein
VLVDGKAAGGGALPYLSLNELLKQQKGPPPSAAAGSSSGAGQ